MISHHVNQLTAMVKKCHRSPIVLDDSIDDSRLTGIFVARMVLRTTHVALMSIGGIRRSMELILGRNCTEGTSWNAMAQYLTWKRRTEGKQYWHIADADLWGTRARLEIFWTKMVILHLF